MSPGGCFRDGLRRGRSSEEKGPDGGGGGCGGTHDRGLSGMAAAKGC